MDFLEPSKRFFQLIIYWAECFLFRFFNWQRPFYRAPMPIFFKEPDIAYYNIPKTGCSSIKSTFIKDRLVYEKNIAAYHQKRLGIDDVSFDEIYRIKFIKNSLFLNYAVKTRGKWRGNPLRGNTLKGEKLKTWLDQKYIFTFTRNPFSRLVSAFQSKYSPIKFNQKGEPILLRFGAGLIQLSKGHQIRHFDELVETLFHIPPFYVNGHFAPQSYLIDAFLDKGGHMDFIGRFENLDKEFEPIRKKYNLRALPHINQSQNRYKNKSSWCDYYNLKTAHMVYEFYKEDFKRFGYERDYELLISHLKSRHLESHHLKSRSA